MATTPPSPLAATRMSREGRSESVASDTAALLGDNDDQSEETAGLASSPSPDGSVENSSLKSRCQRHIVTMAIRSWWRMIVILLTLIVFIPLPLVGRNDAARAAYVIAIMSVYWLTEVVPIAVTALLPLIFFPALGVLSAEDTAINYLRDTNWLFAGGLIIAVAIEKWNFHKRIALLVLLCVGSKPKWILLGFMSTTAFLSMWISNTATAAMMLPIAHAVLEEIQSENEMTTNDRGSGENVVAVRYTRTYNGTGDTQSEDTSPTTTPPDDDTCQDTVHLTLKSENNGTPTNNDDDKDTATGNDITGSSPVVDTISSEGLNTVRECDPSATPRPVQTTNDDSSTKTFDRLTKCLMLGVAYSANIGGTGTLTGTGPNIVLGELGKEFGVNFGLWFIFAMPAMILALFCSWIYLSSIYCDDSFQWCKRRLFKRHVYTLNSQRAKKVIKQQYKKLGRIKYAEVILLVLFVLLALLWLFREPGFIPGWGDIFRKSSSGKSYFTDASTALFIVFLLFIIPSEPIWNFIKAGSSPRLLDWDSVQHKLPWNVIILLGSGFAIADAAEQSGLSDWLGCHLEGLGNLPRPLIAFLVSAIVASVTEVMSNVATTTLFLPVLRDLAIRLSIHPLYLMIPATVSASYAFMVPVATPPNAIAFSYGYLKVYNMVLTGIPMNIVCVAIVTLVLNTTGVAIFGLNSFPNTTRTDQLLTMNTTCS